ncbi:MAG: methyltransferase, partial [Proteobacteria bacterium]|nr:methyltransferase [Pseudomonadota bacterium]
MSSPSSNPLSPALATKVPGSKRNAESFEFRDFTMRQAASGQRLNTDSCVFGGIVGLGLHPKRIIDIGTGTGIVALMLAARYPGVEILAVEPEVEIATIAVDNFKRSPWTEQLNVLTSRAQDLHESKCGQFDFITLNPPYFLHGTQSPDYLRAVARHAFSLGPADIFSVFV